MSQNTTDQEPSIEEILASICQIISDDDEDDKKEEKVEEPLENPVHETRDDVLELSEEEVLEEPEPEPEIEAEPEEEVAEDDEMEIELRDRLDEIRSASAEPKEEPSMSSQKTVPSDILSTATQTAALDSLTKLTKRMPIERSRSYDGVTLEDIVRELLHPMLREWMDENLPPMVERTVQKELEKLARRALDD